MEDFLQTTTNMTGTLSTNYGLIWDSFSTGEAEGESEIKNDLRLAYTLNGENLFYSFLFSLHRPSI